MSDSMRLEKGDCIMAAYAEYRQVWVMVLHVPTQTWRQECLQPEELSDSMKTLWNVSQAAHLAMTRAVQCAVDAVEEHAP